MRATRTLAAVLFAVVCAAGAARAQRIAADRSVQQRLTILDLEDRRAPDVELALVLAGSELLPPDTQRVLVRMLGRLERPSLIPRIVAFLSSRNPAVRAEAANALAQALHVEKPNHDDVQNVQRLLIAALKVERDSGVPGTVARSLGRLPYDTPQQVHEAQAAILGVLKPSVGQPTEALIAGASIAFESLIRLHRRLAPPSDDVVRALNTIVTSHVEHEEARPPAMAALVAAAAVDVDLIDRALGDPDRPEVRRLAAGALRTAAALRPDLFDRALRDTDPQVRFEALRAYGSNPFDGCGRILDALHDASDHVALLAIDLLGGACTSEQNIGEILGGFTANVPQLRDWHRAAHAIVALARRDPPRAAGALPALTSHPAWQVRMYAARAAGTLKDVERLKVLAEDAGDNVREAAIAALNPLVRHEADEIYLAKLKRDDYQLLRTLASVLQGTPQRERATTALFDTLARVTGHKRETSRDVRLALLQRLREVAEPSAASLLKTYLSDFDPRIAGEAADLAALWTGTRPDVSPRPLPRPPPPSMTELVALRGKCAKVTMRWAGSFCLIFDLDAAPLAAIRFVRLVESKYYDGLTFHRVVPNFVLQGGSPGANEYAGDDRYMRDEVGLLVHRRGAVGISTRGRDTGDAQIFIDLADNLRLNHEYTVFASVEELSAGVLDKILEGDTISKIEIVPLVRRQASKKGSGVISVTSPREMTPDPFFDYLTTFTVTSIFSTSPLTGSVADTYCVVAPSLRITWKLELNDRNTG